MKSTHLKLTTILALVGTPVLLALVAVPVPSNPEIRNPVQPRPRLYTEHLDQQVLHSLVKNGRDKDAAELAIAAGDSFFDNLFLFDGVFGVGAQVGQGQKFTRVPRADLKRKGQWASHRPLRTTGPNAMSCTECHTQGDHDGSGFVALNVIRDPQHSGSAAAMIQRNTPHLFGAGAVQILAEEMTGELQAILAEAKAVACTGLSNAPTVTRQLLTKGVDFGRIVVRQVPGSDSTKPVCTVLTQGIVGVDTDLVVRPFQRKGVVASLRAFHRGAVHNEMGLQPVESVGENVDGDGDGVVNELSVGDLTALTVYVAAQPRPVTKEELSDKGWILPMEGWQRESIARGRAAFERVGCASCHRPMMTTRNTVFSEPSQNLNFRDWVFPSGQSPTQQLLSPEYPVRLDLTSDLRYGTRFERDAAGLMKVELFSDLKRHDLGQEDAEAIDEAGTGASTWLTSALWGFGSSAPYLHDGRASTVEEAVEFHGGEAASSRAQYRVLAPDEKEDLRQFLSNLRVWKAPEQGS